MKFARYLESDKVTAVAATDRWKHLERSNATRHRTDLGITLLTDDSIYKTLVALQTSLSLLASKSEQWKEALVIETGGLEVTSGHLIPQKVRDALVDLCEQTEKFRDPNSEQRALLCAKKLQLQVGTSGEFSIDETTYRMIKALCDNSRPYFGDPMCAWVGSPNIKWGIYQSLLEAFFTRRPDANIDTPFMKLRQSERMLHGSVDVSYKMLEGTVKEGLGAIRDFYASYQGGIDVSVISQVESVGGQLLLLDGMLTGWKQSIGICISLAKGQKPTQQLRREALPNIVRQGTLLPNQGVKVPAR